MILEALSDEWWIWEKYPKGRWLIYSKDISIYQHREMVEWLNENCTHHEYWIEYPYNAVMFIQHSDALMFYLRFKR